MEVDFGFGGVRFESNVDLSHSGHAWLPVATVLGMASRRSTLDLQAADSVGLENGREAQRLLREWYKHLHLTDYAVANTSIPPLASGRGVGCFFSGGVDSFYSVLERTDDITHLIFVIGFDIAEDDHELGNAALLAARRAAHHLGKPLIEVKTNVRKISDPLTDWGGEFHGAALATTGILLSQILQRVIIPASYHRDDLHPWGSHPALDPLWSSSLITFEHHGVEATRPEKVRRISSSFSAMQNLRVCWENRNGLFNCGECEKCIRTMINLRSAGALDQCATLPHEFSPQSMRRIRSNHGMALFAKENLRALATSGIEDDELRLALRRVVVTAPLWDTLRILKRSLQYRRSDNASN